MLNVSVGFDKLQGTKTFPFSQFDKLDLTESSSVSSGLPTWCFLLRRGEMRRDIE